jgi:cytochrome P450
MVDYSPVDAEVIDDPFPAYAALRAQCPVHHTDALGRPLYSISRAVDVHDVLLEHRLWSNAKGPGIADSTGSRGDMQHDDQPVHTQRRLHIREWFNPASIARVEASLRATTVDQIESFPDGRADVYRDLALPLPVTSFCELMGVEITDRDRFLRWADEMVVAMAFPERGETARRQLVEFTRNEILSRRERGSRGEPNPPGLLTYIATEPYEDDGSAMVVDEAINMANQLLIAGHETSASLITNCVWRLLEDRTARWERLVAEPDLIPNVVEESLRYDPPVLGLCRTNNETTSIAETEIPQDSKLMVLYASANRDPERFDRPDDFLLDRPMTELVRHYSFSWGIHHCLGAHLARLTGRVVLEELVERRPTLRLDGETTRVPSPFLWGRKTLPVTW